MHVADNSGLYLEKYTVLYFFWCLILIKVVYKEIIGTQNLLQ